MKKIVILMLVLSLFPTSLTFAKEKNEESINTLLGYGIINGTENGTLNFEQTVTKAEAAAALARLLNMPDTYQCGDLLFNDVPAEHWANPYVSFCYEQGIVNGEVPPLELFFVYLDENGNETGEQQRAYYDTTVAKQYYGNESKLEDMPRFEPDKELTYEEAIKMIVACLGYEQHAKEIAYWEGMETYPYGYTTVAEDLGLIPNTSAVDEKNPITRENFFTLIASVLDIPLMKKIIEDDNNVLYYIADGQSNPLSTLRMQLNER